MNADIRLSTGFWEHPKTYKLERSLGLEGIRALQVLWCWVARYSPGDDLAGMDADDIEFAARWEGEHGKLVEELVKLRWIDKVDGGYKLHNWRHHNPWAAAAEDRGARARLSRLAQVSPSVYRELKKEGVSGLSRDEYIDAVNLPVKEALTLAVTESRRDAGAMLAPSPAPSPAPRRTHIDILVQDSFEEFWKAYPRKVAKKAALKAFTNIFKGVKDEQEALNFLRGIDSHIRALLVEIEERKVETKYIPHPSTWLNRTDFGEGPEGI